MANIAKIIGFTFMVIAILLVMKGLQDFRIYGTVFLIYAASSFDLGVITVCLGLIVENTARSAVAQEKIAATLNTDRLPVKQSPATQPQPVKSSAIFADR